MSSYDPFSDSHDPFSRSPPQPSQGGGQGQPQQYQQQQQHFAVPPKNMHFAQPQYVQPPQQQQQLHHHQQQQQLTQQMQQMQLHNQQQQQQQYQYGSYHPNMVQAPSFPPQPQPHVQPPAPPKMTVPMAPPAQSKVHSPKPQENGAGDDFFGDFSSNSVSKNQSTRPPPPNGSVNPPKELRTSNLSVTSSLGSRSSQSAYSHRSVLDDKSFAPPPKYPQSLAVLKNQYISQKQDVASTLPSFDQIKHSGELLSRFSLKSIITKKWKPIFWVSYGNNVILFFRNKSDFEEWVANPYITKEDRDQLVKCRIDFNNDLYMPNVNGYKTTAMRTKSYVRDGLMYHFKLEKWYTYGPVIIAALGGKNEIEVRSIRTIMCEMINMSSQSVKMSTASDTGTSAYASNAQRGSRRGYDSDYTNPHSVKSNDSGIWSKFKKERAAINGSDTEGEGRKINLRRNRGRSGADAGELQKSNKSILRRNSQSKPRSKPKRRIGRGNVDEDEDANHGPAPLGTGY